MTAPGRHWRALSIASTGIAWLAVLLPLSPARAQQASGGPILHIHRSAGEIRVDGDLSDPGWVGAVPIDVWYETNPGDNVEPKVRNVGYLTYDEKYLYAGFEFDDPEPQRIRAPLGDRDNVPSYTDYGGVIIDSSNDRKTAQLFLANPRGIQYDALSSDVSGEDDSPDYYWDAAGRITDKGWVLEMRIPFATLRYADSNPEQWGIMLYRNRPRDFRYQMFSTRLPREVSCFICNENPLVGLTGLPSGGSLVLAPYLTASQVSSPRDGVGTPLDRGNPGGEPGFDAKWVPNPGLAIDATLNPDFSQIESDVAQIASNERFALFFPEKRPFFLEGIDLFSTPLQAVYTRTITSPRWGGRATGQVGSTAYTLLAGQDRGGGSTIIPGVEGSDLADQDFASDFLVGRVRHNIGRSFLSFLVTGRQLDGGGSNRVLGPDFQWRPNDQDTITGQLLFSRSDTPNRPDLADEWDGRRLASHGAELWWNHGTETIDWFLLYNDIGDEFRADNGFIPQVGYRRGYGEVGYTVRPEKGFLSRLRTFLISEYQEDQAGNFLYRIVSPGAGMDGKRNSFIRVRLAFDEVRNEGRIFPRQQVIYYSEVSPTRVLSQVSLEGSLGDEVDFANNRPANGGTLALNATVRPTDHLELRLNSSRRWLDVDAGTLGSGRLFTARVERLRATYTFSSRMFLRLIGQYVQTKRDPGLYLDEVEAKSGAFAGSALFAYKLNWQSVLFLGYADNRELVDGSDLEPADRQIFLKLSYAFQF